jgi:hypothetical protein
MDIFHGRLNNAQRHSVTTKIINIPGGYNLDKEKGNIQ